uniref:U4/U6 small nuclear ribonucleoprotein Prp3 n=1 Tax=Ciona intestinalis TaxID=7719 RepID=UPI00089DBC4C|nr:U4/U6 small nuclear ribonucleoprotein Prp3 [Ciona intestinalis]|eukprot:XP_018671483.1 U4/U6 small nuclear ribonucleoprotein Prp3 [Ciona intestinalis]
MEVVKSRKRKENGVHDETTKKSRKFSEPEEKESKDDKQKNLSAQEIKKMMEMARQQIQQRKEQIKQLNPVALSAKVQLAQAKTMSSESQQELALITSAAEKAQKAAELQARIQARLAAKPNLIPGMAAGLQAKLFTAPNIAEQEQTAPKPLILDEMGRTIDATGQLLNIPSRVPTLKANIRAKKREEFRQKLHEKPPSDETSGGINFFDNRVKQETASRPRRNFKFHEKGRFVKIAQKIRTKAQLEKLQGEISHAAKRTGIQQASKLALIAPKVGPECDVDAIPNVEWWDAYIDNRDNHQVESVEIAYDAITNLIEHPAQLNAPGSGRRAPVLTTYLTKKERKKMRRMNRREALKDEQEKVRLGLAPAPEPKVKLSNLMRVLGTDAVQDPTKVEKHVRMQMAKRQRAHEQANAARKLTDVQKREKKIKKLKEDTSDVVHVTMYRIRNLRDPSKKFKVEMNSKQLY